VLVIATLLAKRDPLIFFITRDPGDKALIYFGCDVLMRRSQRSGHIILRWLVMPLQAKQILLVRDPFLMRLPPWLRNICDKRPSNLPWYCWT